MKKLDGSLSVTFVNRNFFSDYQDVSVINTGECFRWAYTAYHLYKNLELWSMGAHAFVRSKVTGKFYDSERPRGVKDWRDLPATNFGKGCGCYHCLKPARKVSSVKDFKNYWERMAKKFETNWQEVNQKINKVIKEN